MPLQPFVFPFPETRLLNADGTIFKFKIRPGSTFRCVDFNREEGFHEEFEEIVRTVLGNLNNLTPFSSTHYTVYPYKEPWKSFTEPGLTWQRVYPHVLILYVEKNLDNGIQTEKKNKVPVPRLEPCSLALKPKRRRTESPLEEAIIKELAEDMEVRRMPSLTHTVDVGNKHAEEEVKQDPAHVVKKTTERVDGTEDAGYMEAEEEDEEEEEDEDDDDDDDDEDTAAKGGFLTRLASYIFPFSLFSRGHGGQRHKVS